MALMQAVGPWTCEDPLPSGPEGLCGLLVPYLPIPKTRAQNPRFGLGGGCSAD